jgi:hypothetical protein
MQRSWLKPSELFSRVQKPLINETTRRAESSRALVKKADFYGEKPDMCVFGIRTCGVCAYPARITARPATPLLPKKIAIAAISAMRMPRQLQISLLARVSVGGGAFCPFDPPSEHVGPAFS